MKNVDERLNKSSNDLDIERDKNKMIWKELTNKNEENSGLLNEITKKENELYMTNQKLSLNDDMYQALKLKFDEI